MTGAIRRSLEKDKSNFDPRKFLKEATVAAKDICKARFEAFGCAGQASKIKAISLEDMANRYAKGELNAVIK
jgi:fructose-bisphosphate aldolase class II